MSNDTGATGGADRARSPGDQSSNGDAAYRMGRRPFRDAAMANLMFETGLHASEVALLDIGQVGIDGGQLLGGTVGTLSVARREDQPGSAMPLSHQVCKMIALYLKAERHKDADTNTKALFLRASKRAGDLADTRMTAEEIDLAVGGEDNLRRVRTPRGAAISVEELDGIWIVAREWARQNACPHPEQMQVVSTTADAAAKALQGKKVTALPDRAVYLVALKGHFILARSQNTVAGTWAALLVHQSEPLRVAERSLRLAGPDLNDLGLGRVYSLACDS